MKVKFLFAAVLATMALTSCDKENTTNNPAEKGKTKVIIKKEHKSEIERLNITKNSYIIK